MAALSDLKLRRIVRTVIHESTDETTMGHMRGLTERKVGQVSRTHSLTIVAGSGSLCNSNS